MDTTINDQALLNFNKKDHNDQKETIVEKNSVINTYDSTFLPDMLPLYYKRLFPHKLFYRWLSYGLSEDGIFANREISFTLRDDIVQRYLCYETQGEMEKDICLRCPYKIDIGAVLNTKPKNNNVIRTGLMPKQRELVFDIDMTDYDDVRTCCSGADICEKCWKFMVVACRILDIGLKDDFGWEHIFWVYSGRRGIHCWVCDYDARHLDVHSRQGVAEYFQLVSYVVIDGISVPRACLGEKIHHSIKRSLKIIEPLFEEIILNEQNIFCGMKGINKLCLFIPDDAIRKEIEQYLVKQVGNDFNSQQVWDNFKRYVYSMRVNSNSTIWPRRLKNIIEDIQICCLYPRLDINVTKGFNHLLKAPFCIHPSTGKVCLPFSANAVAKFNPVTVPTISDLLQEINVFDEKNKIKEDSDDYNRSCIKDYKKTSMFKGIVVFEEFIRKLEFMQRLKLKHINAERLDF